jgi:flagellar protein FlbD
LKGAKFALNSDHIETIEETPDTVVTLLNGHKYVVCERTKEIVSMIETFRRNSSRSSASGYIPVSENE